MNDNARLNLLERMEALYIGHPVLREVELHGKHRLNERRAVLNHAPKQGVGAEIGVFTGMFSEILVEETNPRILYLVDPWAKLHGSHYPNWGTYTAGQRLPTDSAKEAAELRAHHMNVTCEVFEAFSEDWLEEHKDPFLDWVYLDASHKHSSVLRDLISIAPKMRPNGVIMGDDCWMHSKETASGVATALNDFLEDDYYDIIHLDNHGQWAISRSDAASDR